MRIAKSATLAAVLVSGCGAPAPLPAMFWDRPMVALSEMSGLERQRGVASVERASDIRDVAMTIPRRVAEFMKPQFDASRAWEPSEWAVVGHQRSREATIVTTLDSEDPSLLPPCVGLERGAVATTVVALPDTDRWLLRETSIVDSDGRWGATVEFDMASISEGLGLVGPPNEYTLCLAEGPLASVVYVSEHSADDSVAFSVQRNPGVWSLYTDPRELTVTSTDGAEVTVRTTMSVRWTDDYGAAEEEGVETKSGRAVGFEECWNSDLVSRRSLAEDIWTPLRASEYLPCLGE